MTTTADIRDREAESDGLTLTGKQYAVVVSTGAVIRHRSEPMSMENASQRMAKIIGIHMSAMGYKQDVNGEAVTLRKGGMSVQIQIVEVQS